MQGDTNATNYQPGPEVKAFLYQQLQDLQQYVSNTSQFQVGFEKRPGDGSKGRDKYVAYLNLGTQDDTIEAQGEGEDIFDACIQVKDNMIFQLNLMTDFSGSSERAQHINSIIHGGALQIH